MKTISLKDFVITVSIGSLAIGMTKKELFALLGKNDDINDYENRTVVHTFSEITDELKIVSESTFCTFCYGVIQQFRTMFPNLKLIIVNGVN